MIPGLEDISESTSLQLLQQRWPKYVDLDAKVIDVGKTITYIQLQLSM